MYTDQNRHDIMPGGYIRTLGFNFTCDLTWGNLLKPGEKGLIPLVNKKLGAMYIAPRGLSMICTKKTGLGTPTPQCCCNRKVHHHDAVVVKSEFLTIAL